MSDFDKAWIVVNEKSGSNEPAALEALYAAFEDNGIEIARRFCFPDDGLPDAASLDDANIPLVAIFGGDGTINSAVTKLYGWGGAVLCLPGGTMNLLPKRLHGDVPAADIVDRVARGKAVRKRPTICRTACGDALAGLLAGSGTSWGHVREAMREVDAPEILSATTEAIAKTAAGPRLVCRDPAIGREEGYPLLVIEPVAEGLNVSGYYADGTFDLLEHGLNLLRRNFRAGPHEELGVVKRLVAEGEVSTGLLLDGERYEGEREQAFEVAFCEVDLLATRHDD